MAQEIYPIGSAGLPWGADEKAVWLTRQTIQRSYQDQVVAKIEKIRQRMAQQVVVEQYGELPYAPHSYPLWAIKTGNWQAEKPTILITGGVHGYETSGVQGALRFVESELDNYTDRYNFIVAPCVSPWGYETVNRWNPAAIDPNRSFHANSQALESASVMQYVRGINAPILAHIDLHETTDTDNTEFRPALAARDAIEQKAWDIPDGFYAVGDTLKPVPEFQKAIIDAVEQVTHIAPADASNQLIGTAVAQRGVINYATKELGLCAGFTDARFVTTTEVYPDSPKVDDENCIVAQVAAVTGALKYLRNENGIT